MTYADRATQYARDVVGGKVLACELVKLACQRHLDDLKRDDLEWDEDAVNTVCGFLELLPHVKGNRWRGATLKLEDWQCFLVGVPFGWKRDGKRRFRRVYAEVPRKNGKSVTSAGVGLYAFCADDEYGAEVYSGATTEKQAWEVFGPARLMAKNTPDLVDHYGVSVNAKNLHRLGANAKYEPVIGNPGDGASPHFAITDEYHEHNTSDQLDTMITGMGSREQPIAWTITTAGYDTSGPCYKLRNEALEVLRGQVENDEFFTIVYTIDDGDDWTSEDALRKANPNMGVSVFDEFLQSQQRDAVNNPHKQSTFKTKHLNVWVGAGSPFFNLEKWNRLADESLNPNDFHGETCWHGLDLASKLDLSGVVLLFRRELEGEEHFYAFGRPYMPEERAYDPAFRNYEGWARAGHIITTPGNVTDYDYIESDILDDAERHRIAQLGYDPWNAQHMVNRLSAAGVECVEVPQTTPRLSEPMKWVQAVIEDGRIHHDGNPVFAWCIGNVTAQEDRNGNVFPRKEKGTDKKIDLAVALIIAMGRAWVDEESSGSYLESGELLVL